MAQGASIPVLKELAEFSTRAAKAAAQLGGVRDADVDLATTPREAILTINGRTLYRVSVAGLPSRGEATALCERVRRGGGNCFVRASAGDRPIATAFRQTPTRLASR